MKSILSLIGTGAILGVVHVLSGPDHLSAIATLSANVGQVGQAFWLGVQWGVGHSIGLLVVGSVLIALHEYQEEEQRDNRIDVPDNISTLFESLVGIFMIVLGLYGIRRAGMRKVSRGYNVVETPWEHGQESLSVDGTEGDRDEEAAIPSGEEDRDDFVTASEEDNAATDVSNSPGCGWRRLLAVCAGIVHGLAGPGGVLGVIPAVQLHDSKLAIVYLGTFCTVSSLTMGVFATCYGSCSSRLSGSTGSREFLIECISACLSILVGLIWLVLLSLGKLDDVFP